jgi:DNA-binding NtrC family response regulator
LKHGKAGWSMLDKLCLGGASFLAIADYSEAKRQFEIAYVKAKLREHGGNIIHTAAIGIHRQSLQEKLRELGIQAEKE